MGRPRVPVTSGARTGRHAQHPHHKTIVDTAIRASTRRLLRPLGLPGAVAVLVLTAFATSGAAGRSSRAAAEGIADPQPRGEGAQRGDLVPTPTRSATESTGWLNQEVGATGQTLLRVFCWVLAGFLALALLGAIAGPR